MSWAGTGLSAEQQDVVGLVEALLDDHGPVTTPEAAVAVRRQLARSGLWGVAVPEEAGGGGADEVTFALVAAVLAGTCGGVAWSFVQANAGGLALTGTPAAGTLETLVSGESCLGVVDAGPLLDAASALDRGVRTQVLDEMEALVVVAGTDEAVVVRDGLVATAVPTTGFDTAPCRVVRRDGTGAAPTQLPAGAGPVRRLLVVGSLAVATGLARSAAERAGGYVRERVQFGAPLTAIPSVRAALEHHDRVVVELAEHLRNVAQTPWETLVAVAGSAPDRAIDVSASALQLHGGYGYIDEYAVERMLRDAVTLRAISPAASAQEGLTRARFGIGVPA